MNDNPLLKLIELKDAVGIIGAAITVIFAMIANPQWPVLLVLLMLCFMGFVIYRLLEWRQKKLEGDIVELKDRHQRCEEAHQECTSKFEEVLAKINIVMPGTELDRRAAERRIAVIAQQKKPSKKKKN